MELLKGNLVQKFNITNIDTISPVLSMFINMGLTMIIIIINISHVFSTSINLGIVMIDIINMSPFAYQHSTTA